ncbi:methenyltetrahydromethanopterin cyclohydrolase [Jiella sp. MQZ9-1]|uniref:Methenyltetrahydromethanopterin cyclohydrolase n=1 Tax=Jiella flava TaxID=2816857 RepID=A0A939G054_9HYPH|nr:methenyltetrahydromethanopterin cyclohydrolase [Jiella flava]MBO0663386.1 methenyltetrahydromethanopterin cyclohydrolase [Jiella flava]MCD2471962.1 methenyltetrahydromethanopterin cyclohydrolase [Jiella flava]
MIQTRVLSVNAGVQSLVADLKQRARELKVAISTGAAGETVIDAGAAVPGSLEAGRIITEICLGGYGSVVIGSSERLPRWPFALTVRSSNPVIACMGSQYAGWQLTNEPGEPDYFSMGSGPARALAGKEALFKDITYADQSDTATLVLEAGSPPPEALVRRIADDCDIAPEKLTIIFTPTQSLAGSVQIVGRVVEVALHKAHELHFDMSQIVEGMGTAPLAPPHPDFLTAMGRTNDAVIYGGRVTLHVTGPADAARALAERLPSSTSEDYGKPFKEIFSRYDGDFYKIDGMLFSPAAVQVVALESGETFSAGAVNPDLIDASFG